MAPGSKIGFEYDSLNRLKTTAYGDGSRRLPTTQVLGFGGQSYTLGTLYNSNGHMTQLNYPTEGNPIGTKSVAYSPDALGRPTRVGNFATGIRYHPSGAIASFTYGNGKIRTMTQNMRGLPEFASDSGVVQDRYRYDPNGNVASIADELPGNVGSKTLG